MTSRLETLVARITEVRAVLDQAILDHHELTLAITDERAKNAAASPADSRGEGEPAPVAAGVNDGSSGLDGSPLRRGFCCAQCPYHAKTQTLLDNHVRAVHNRVLWLSERAAA